MHRCGNHIEGISKLNDDLLFYIMNNNKLIRLTTVPISLKILLKGQHRYMSSNGFDVIGVSSKGDDLNDVHEIEHIPVVSIEMTRTISPLADLMSLWNFYRLCKKEKPTIVHSHTPKAGVVGMLGAKLAGVPIRLHTVAGMPLMEATGFKRTILDFVEKLTYSAATKVYPNSEGLCHFIINNRYTTSDKVKVIGNGSSNGIDTTFFSSDQMDKEQLGELRDKIGVKKENFVFVFVGRLVGDKGINELISGFRSFSANLEGQGQKVKLLLVGPLETELDPLASETLEEINKNADIISVGFQKDVRPYFALSDALIFPSYREGFPNVVMQAGSMGLPCIVSDINGCNEIIIDGENGLIIPVKNVEAIQMAMTKFVNDVDFFNKLKSNSRKLIQDRYEQKVVWKALLTEYNNLLEKKDFKNV